MLLTSSTTLCRVAIKIRVETRRGTEIEIRIEIATRNGAGTRRETETETGIVIERGRETMTIGEREKIIERRESKWKVRKLMMFLFTNVVHSTTILFFTFCFYFTLMSLFMYINK